jgi:hypothetical protein
MSNAAVVSLIAAGTLLVAMAAFLVTPIHVGGADCGTLFTSSDQWTSSPDTAAPDAVQLICHNGHTNRLVWVVALASPALALLCLAAARYLRTRHMTR